MDNLEKNQIVDESQPVPYVVHESDMARFEQSHKEDMDRLERANRRQFWIIIILIAVIIAGFCWFEWRESQFADEVWTFEAATDAGGTAVANGTGEVNFYGEGEGNSQTARP